MNTPTPNLTIRHPVVTGIETTNHCHCHCRICPHDAMVRPRGFIEPGLFALAARQVAVHCSRRMISLHHFGDPLLHPALPALIQVAEDAGLKSKLSTVGSHLSPGLIDSLVDSPLSILKFSFWGLDREQFEACQRVSFDRTLANISALLGKGPRCRVVIEILAPAGTDISSFPRYPDWKEFLKLKPVRNWTGDVESVNAFTGIPYQPAVRPCEKMWWSDLKILWNGDVTPCCRDYDGRAVVGNITRESIAEIWTGTAMDRLREAHTSGQRAAVPLCRRCSATAARHTRAHERPPRRERDPGIRPPVSLTDSLNTHPTPGGDDDESE